MKKLIFNKKVQIIFVVALTFAIVMYLFVPKNLPCKNTNPLVQTTENTLSSDQGSLFNQYSQLTNLTGEDYEEYQLQKQFAFDIEDYLTSERGADWLRQRSKRLSSENRKNWKKILSKYPQTYKFLVIKQILSE